MPARVSVSAPDPEGSRVVFTDRSCESLGAVVDPGAPDVEGDRAVWAVTFPAAGTFHACWCTTDCRMPIGTVEVLGVEQAHRTCAAAESCSVRVSLLARPEVLDSAKVRVEIRESRAACGEKRGNGTIYSVTRYSSTAVEVSFVPVAAGQLRVCVCIGLGGCNEAIEFVQDAGSISLSGAEVAASAHVCYLRTACVIRVAGVELQAEDAVMVHPDACVGRGPGERLFLPLSFRLGVNLLRLGVLFFSGVVLIV